MIPSVGITLIINSSIPGFIPSSSRIISLSKTGNYNITFLKMPGTVSSAADPDGGPIASGQTLSATINVPSDLDAFQFYGQAGERVIINAITTSGTLNTRILPLPSGGGPAEADSVGWITT